MAGKAITKETIKKNTIEDMKKLGVYKGEYDAIIDIYSELREQYERLTIKYKESGYKYYEETDRGGNKKSTLVMTLEPLRKDILTYADKLCINPKALSDKNFKDKKGDKKQISMLGKALMELENL